MKRALLIAEKPSLMRTLQDVYSRHKKEFDFEITFMAQRGHLLRLKRPDEVDSELKQWKWEHLPIHPENMGGWHYVVIEEKKVGNNPTSKERFNAIKKEYNSGVYDFIINAGDPDREGQLLIRETIQALKANIPVKRFWSNDLTEDAVLKELKNLKDDDKDDFLVNITKAAYCRQHSDYRFGMNLTEAASLKMKGRAALGRVKTPILSIVCQREVDIENFKPSTSYGVRAKYVQGFEGQYYVAASSESEEDSDEKENEKGLIYFDTKSEADRFISSLPQTATVVDYQTKKVSGNAPKLFKLASCQVAAGKYGFDPTKTLAIIQSLYEKTYLSYPRTDCECISSHEDLSSMINSVKCIPSLKTFAEAVSSDDIARVLKTSKYVNDKELEKHGHSALTPTSKIPDFNSLSSDEKIIYELVCRQFIAIFLPPLVQNKVTLLADCGGKLFKSSGKTLVDKGYTVVFDTSFTDHELPLCKRGDVLNIGSFDVVEKTTTCPKRFSETDIINVCENPKKFLMDERLKNTTKELHIGTSATRAPILKQLIDRDKYLKLSKEGKKEYVIPTENGRKIWENLKDCMICRVDMTAEWEEALDKVGRGELSVEALEKQMMDTVELLINDIKKKDMQGLNSPEKKGPVCKCPSCGGDIIPGEKSFFCSNWKEKGCKCGMYKKICDSSLTENEVASLLSGEQIKKKIKKGTKSWESLLKYSFESNKIEFCNQEPAEVKFSCPACGGKLTDSYKAINCSCGFRFWKVAPGGKMLTDTQIKNFFEKGSTGVISGLISSKGDKYSGEIVLNDEKNGTKIVAKKNK